ncbi:MAG: VWA domain-containing protein [Pyrinomonadaceae bacterium]
MAVWSHVKKRTRRTSLSLRALRYVLRFKPFAAFLLFSTCILSASQLNLSAQQKIEAEEVLRVRTDLVLVPALVTDARGQRISGLTQTDFQLLDNGQPVNIDYFASGTERVALLFALDSSGSVRDQLAQQQQAALSLFSRFGRASQVAVLHFGEAAKMTLPFSNDSDAAQSAFNYHAPLGTHTAILDAAATAVRAFDARTKIPNERRIIILVSDGLDTASRTDARVVINDARARGISFYIIHFPIFTPVGNHLEPRSPAKGFRDLATATGGLYFKVGDAKSALDPRSQNDLAPIFKAIEDDLQGQYMLGFYPGEQARDNKQHRININLTQSSRRKLKARALREEYTLKQ